MITLEEFNDRVGVYNGFLGCSIFKEDRWWLWQHRALRNPRYIIEGVHLNQSGMAHYVICDDFVINNFCDLQVQIVEVGEDVVE